MRTIDLRSDTCSQPDDGMRKAMCEAIVGNDSWEEDPSANLLLEQMRELTGKEAGLFCCSGTMSNVTAAMTHKSILGFGSEVMMDQFSHSNWYEVGNLATIAGMSIFPVANNGDYLSEQSLNVALRPKSKHMTVSNVLWIENTYMLGGGLPVPLNEMERLYTFAKAHQMKIHLDGARLLNAAVALDVEPSKLTHYADSVQICLSKGLGAPFGSVLLGDKDFIETAKRCRQALGGGLRQAGIMAAAGSYALKNYKYAFQIMHQQAKDLAEGLAKILSCCLNPKKPATNMILIDTKPLELTTAEFCARLMEMGIKVMPAVPTPYGERARMMIYPGITDEDIQYVLQCTQRIV